MNQASPRSGLNPVEKRVTAILAGVYSVRMTGLFMLLPVIALYASGLPHATPMLIGLAVGVYGISQALLQVPFGMLSDRLGRKPVIIFGLLVFIAGSVVAARADTIGWLIAGRTIQGAGAISAAITALLADQTRPAYRTRAMAVVGITIGASFMLSLITGPVLASLFGVKGLFWLAAGLGLIAIALVGFAIPAAAPRPAESRNFVASIAEPALRVLYGGIFVLHLALTSLFVVLPLQLKDKFGFAASQHWKLYLSSMLLSLSLTVPLILTAERPGPEKARRSLALAVGLCAAGLILLAETSQGVVLAGLALLLFFAGFNFLEARMPAMLSIKADAANRGAALGLYATCQFLGAFAGGAIGGLLLDDGHPGLVYLLAAVLLAGWWWLSRRHDISEKKPDSGVRNAG